MQNGERQLKPKIETEGIRAERKLGADETMDGNGTNQSSPSEGGEKGRKTFSI